MNKPKIQLDSQLMNNMFSVHLFHLDVLKDMEEVMKNSHSTMYEKFNIDWDKSTTNLFFQAVKYYLNYPKSFWEQARQRQKATMYEEISSQSSKRIRSTTSKSQTPSSFLPPIKEEALDNSDIFQDEESNKPKPKQTPRQFNQDTFATTTRKNSEAKVREEEKSQKDTEGKEGKEERDSDDEDEDDLADYLEYQKNPEQNPHIKLKLEQCIKMEEPTKLKVKVQEEVKDKLVRNGFKLHTTSNKVKQTLRIYEEKEQRYHDYIAKAEERTNCIIFGMYTSGQLKHRPKEGMLHLEMTNCFLKTVATGRDAFFERVCLQLFRVEKKDAPLE